MIFLGCSLPVKITYFGSEKDIAKAVAVIKRNRSIARMKEPKARLKIQRLIDEEKLKASILVNGNTVWSKDRILKNLRRIMRCGTLYNAADQSKPPILSQYFYQFLHLCCGSVAHYDIYGWIHKYPTVEHLRKFFKSNEFGERVIDYIPRWKTDAHKIVEAIERTLFPFQTYMKQER
jgi:hypothetical protein